MLKKRGKTIVYKLTFNLIFKSVLYGKKPRDEETQTLTPFIFLTGSFIAANHCQIFFVFCNWAAHKASRRFGKFDDVDVCFITEQDLHTKQHALLYFLSRVSGSVVMILCVCAVCVCMYQRMITTILYILCMFQHMPYFLYFSNNWLFCSYTKVPFL